MPHAILSPEALQRALSLRDLTDPSQGPHAMQRLVDAAVTALRDAWGCPALEERADPVVTVADNYDRLLYPPGGAARDARYTRYVASDRLLRTQTSAMIPPLLRRLATAPPSDLLVSCPGLVWRRDRIDRLHVGEPHQLDLWRIRRGQPLGSSELSAMVRTVIGALLPGRPLKTISTVHPYTAGGLEIHVEVDGEWIEVAECGVAHPRILRDAGLPDEWSGLAMGLGLDRILMLAKGLDDLRLLRSSRSAGHLAAARPGAVAAGLRASRRSAATSRWPSTSGCRPRSWATGCARRSAPGPTTSRPSRSSPRPPTRRCPRRPAPGSAWPPARRTCWCGSRSARSPARSPTPRPTGSATRSTRRSTRARTTSGPAARRRRGWWADAA